MRSDRFAPTANGGSAALESRIVDSIKEWLESVRDRFESVTAAAGMWEVEVVQRIAPALGVEFIATAAKDAPVTGVFDDAARVGWPDGVAGPETVDRLLADYPATFAGVDPSQVSFIVASPSWRASFASYMRNTVNLVVGMEDSTFYKMQELLSSVRLGGSFEQKERVRQFLSWEAEGGYEGWMRRAERIARTELHAARSNAVYASAKMTADAGVPMDKMWNASHDERTRPDHAEADGQVRGMDEPFNIGGEPLMFPGDREHGSARQTIQCRCTATYVERGDAVDLNWVKGITNLGDIERQIKELDMAMVASAETALAWKGRLAPVGEPTGDGRIFTNDGEFRFREFPLPLLWQESTGEGHNASRVVGTIEKGEVTADGFVAEGTVFADEEKVISLLRRGVIRPSVDLCDMEATAFVEDDTDVERLHVSAATVMAATLVAKPAFENVGIQLTGEEVEVDAEGLVASAGVVVDFPVYAAESFGDPGLSEPTPVTVTEHGRVFGHLALWDSCHVGQPGRCVAPPRSESSYASFHQSTIHTKDGMLAVGRLTVGGGHAGARAGVRAAAEHYDQTGSCWAFVRAGEDEHGIWVAGEINRDCAAEKVREAASAPLSGDWRRVGGGMELVAALSVSTPGFPVRREYVAGGEEMSLVAAAEVKAPDVPVTPEALQKSVYDALAAFFNDKNTNRPAELTDEQRTRYDKARAAFTDEAELDTNLTERWSDAAAAFNDEGDQ